MNLNIESDNSDVIQPVVESVETVEVISGSDSIMSPPGTKATSNIVASSHLSIPSSGMIEIDPHTLTCTLVEMANQQLVQGNSMLSSSLTASLPTSIMSVGESSPLVVGTKRSLMSEVHGNDFGEDIPRKKSRNYLDSHKSIEKKRRDRINTGLSILRDMVPDCRQYGSKKLDKAEIIEFTIQYVKKLHSQRTGDVDIATSQREWANDLMTWVFQNKLLYTGPNALEQFCNALLLNLQTYGNPPQSLSSPSNVLLNQGVSGASSDDESIMRSQTNLIHQLVSSIGQQGGGETPTGKLENTPNTQQIAQIQALLVLQQQQLLGHQQNPEGSGHTNGAPSEENNAVNQLQQLQQLQAFLLQHIASESGHHKCTSDDDMGVTYSHGGNTETNNADSTDKPLMDDGSISVTSGVDISLSSAIANTVDDPSPAIYTTTSLEENLLDSTGSVQGSSQMWSGQDSALLLDGGVQEHSIENEVVQEEVELLSSTQQDQ